MDVIEESKQTFGNIGSIDHLRTFANPEFFRNEIMIGCFVTDDFIQHDAGTVLCSHLGFISSDEDVEDKYSKGFGMLCERNKQTLLREERNLEYFTSGFNRAPITSMNVWASNN